MPKKLRIGIIFHYAEAEGTGNCTYVRNLIERLSIKESPHDYVLYIKNPAHPYYERFKKFSNVTLSPIKTRSFFVRLFRIGIQTYNDKIDILWAQYVAPFFHRGKSIITIHDLAFLHYPDFFKKTERFCFRVLIPLSIKKAAAIITPSHFTGNDIGRQYPFARQKVKVIHSGYSSIFNNQHRNDDAKRLKELYAIEEPYILYVGRINARKNIDSLIKSYRALRASSGIPHTLVIVGRVDFLVEPFKSFIAEVISTMPDIKILQYVSHEELPLLYRTATVFVYPSFFEGFGLPLLEAMACGCPVVSSAASAIPEIAGDAAVLVDPKNTGSLTTALYSVLFNHDLQDALRQKGLEHIKIFDWNAAAEKIFEVLNSV